MNFSLAGVNHRTAPITIREKAAIRAGKLNDTLSLLSSHVSQGIILSTCNRTEVYTVNQDGYSSEKASLEFLGSHLGMSDTDLQQYTYVYKDDVAIEHLFRIACGLDSMILGEYEVLGQVGRALEIAEKAGMASLPLRHIFQSAIRTGRRVREETGISKNALSVSSVAVDLASKIVGSLEGCKMLVIGAGEAGELVAKAAIDRGASNIIIASRTQERASTLAATLDGKPINLGSLVEELKTCSIIVTCADAPHWILNVNQIENVMRDRSELPLVIIDIAVPRNVEPAAERINNVFLYNIDGLTQTSDLNRRQREREVMKAEKIITTEMAKLITWQQDFKVRPIVGALMSKAEEIRANQLKKTLVKMHSLSDEERDDLDAMTKSIVTKILQDPIKYLKTCESTSADYAGIVDELFQLGIEK
jgi:glutamyl-tRNA reductase